MDVDAVTRQLARSFPILRELELRLQGTPCDVREVLRTVGESLESVTDLKVQVSDDPDTGASERDIGSRGLGLVGVNPRKFTRLLLDQNSLTGDELMQVLDSQRELADLRLGSVSYAQTLMRLEGRVYHQLTRLALGRLKLEGSAHRQWGLNAVVFPNLRSLIIADFCVSNGDIGSAVGTFEQLFAQPWASLVEVSVPLLTNNIISKIVEACSHSLEALRFRIGGPERANRSETFQLIIRDKLLLTSAGFATLVTKLPKLAMLELLNESGGLQAVTHLDGTIVRPPRARRALRWECRFLCVLRIARTFLTPTSFWDIVDQLPQLCCVDTGIKAEPEWLFENDGGKTSIEAITKSRSDRHQNLRYIKLSVKSPTIPYELWAQMATLLPRLTTLTFVSGMYLRARYKSICYQLSYEFPSIHFRAETKSCLPI
ncbi:hypothetical protein EV182_005563 [Spiromyces aspiralis]|uniref:Uncharacterized protein n=1 Tax=Spiromyces aspiralis TaxID=68401 RepID=A0ACC1HQV8_9FUNG|nr:hypothetical protein EV182_005563 [Spiromyces aspiralis]